MRILLAPDSFKGTMAAKEVCDIMARACFAVCPSCAVTAIPVADGGEGLCESLAAACAGEVYTIAVSGVFGEQTKAHYALLPDGTGVVEMAQAAGLPLAGERMNPETASTYGVGELLLAAKKQGAKRILLGLGGSATNDCGIGLAAALGYRFLDANGQPVEPVGKNMQHIAAIAAPREPYGLPVTAACDVTNPLYGPNGAAFVYAPQKGADADMVQRLDTGLAHLAAVLQHALGKDVAHEPGAGAAGGMGAGVLAFLDGTLQSGIDLFLDAVQFDAQLEKADVVFTGEGKFDAQSLQGKVISGIERRARQKGVPVVLVCGCREETTTMQHGAIAAVYACGPLGVPLAQLQMTCRADLYKTTCNALQQFLQEGSTGVLQRD